MQENCKLSYTMAQSIKISDILRDFDDAVFSFSDTNEVVLTNSLAMRSTASLPLVTDKDG